MDTDRTTYAPCIFFEYDDSPGTFCLMLTDGEMIKVADLFEAAGYEPNGYMWNGLAHHLVDTRGIDATDVGFDPEAGMFVAYGKNEASLRALGEALRDLFHDRDALAAMLAEVDLYEWD